MAVTAPEQHGNDRRIVSEAVITAAQTLDLTNSQLARILGTSASTVSRLKRGETHLDPGTKQWELGLLLIRVYRSLGAIAGGDKRVMQQWLRNPNEGLGGLPLERLYEVTGITEVANYLDAHRGVA
ncbi:antitoxin Xre/MbcA/ParS toxin-binding domain-containing protein [Thiohalorhabdus sp.]|uniref:antitoxin Xre/MbcA/ParS toxin-binding domain-containing protein n=1 Tax=Thiohalorhabdus sp. TaxID=3094134 RepID=UPI002FC2CFAA